jgi:hypothetical protein
MLPFSAQEFLGVFERYNRAVWPFQVLLLGLALGLIPVARSQRPGAARVVSLGLAALWAWMGVVYHFAFFRAINPAALGFAGLCLVEAGVLAVRGVDGAPISDADIRRLWRTCGAILLAFALVIYPLLSIALGHRYPAAPTFGLPCPTTIYTFGLLLLRERTVPGPIIAIPLVWAAIGATAAALLGMKEDMGLGAGALVMVALLLRQRGLRPAH